MIASPAAAQTTTQTGSAAPQATDRQPVIDDKEFDSSIPPIDADPNAPIGTAKDWEAKQKQLEQRNPKVVPPTRAPASASSQAVAPPLKAPPGNDPDIDKPLTPLTSFNVEPFDDSRYTEADDTKPSTVRYTYKVEGLDTIADDSTVAPVTAGDIHRQFRRESTLEDGDGKATNGAMINARMIEDEKLLADVLSSQGFLDATVHGSLSLPEAGSNGPIAVTLTAVPGPRYRLGTIRFDAPPVTPADLITNAFLPRAGEPIVADRIVGAEANIGVVLPQNGYPFAKTGNRDILLHADTRLGDYVLPVQPGVRSSFGDIVSGGKRPVFKPRHIAVLARFKKGELYDSRKVDDLRQALVATGLFSTISVLPQPTGVRAGDGTDYATLLVEQTAGPARTLAAQLGYGTGEGIKLEGSWTHRNLFPPEGALIATATAGTQEQGAGVTFRRSNAGKRDRSVELSLTADHSNFDAFEAFTGRLAGSIARVSTPIWQKRWTYSYGFELLGSNEQDYDFAAGKRRRRTYYVFALPGQLTYDASNSLLDPTKGFRLSARVSPEASLGSGKQGYGRFVFEGSGYYSLSSFTLAGRARVGSIVGADRSLIAPSRRFYAGGGGSVRGFGYQELGPKDPEARPIGGRSLVEAAAEVRYRFGNYGIVGFLDGGQVYTSSVPRFTNWRFGAGIGGRFYTNFGPMRLDVATPIARKKGESRIAIYVSIGQAF